MAREGALGTGFKRMFASFIYRAQERLGGLRSLKSKEICENFFQAGEGACKS